MGELIALAERRADRSRRHGRAEAAFFYDLACPFSYLAAERVERLLGEVEWIPVAGSTSPSGHQTAELRARAEHRAAELRLPLVWPDRFPAGVPGALRTAVRAGEVGAGARFGLWARQGPGGGGSGRSAASRMLRDAPWTQASARRSCTLRHFCHEGSRRQGDSSHRAPELLRPGMAPVRDLTRRLPGRSWADRAL